MSKTAQRKRQAYEEGHRDAMRSNGIRYSRHPFMDDYRRGFEDGQSAAQPKTALQRMRERFA